MKFANAAGAAILSVVLIAAAAGAFSPSEKKTITNLRARITALEDGVAALTARVEALEPVAFTFSDITVTPSPPCSPGTCWVDVEWNVTPCATGQVEWGLTTDYGHETEREDQLLCYHKQRISGLEPDTEYQFRVIATDGSDLIASAVAA